MIFERESRWRDIPAIILAVLHYILCRCQSLSCGSFGCQLMGFGFGYWRAYRNTGRQLVLWRGCRVALRCYLAPNYFTKRLAQVNNEFHTMCWMDVLM